MSNWCQDLCFWVVILEWYCSFVFFPPLVIFTNVQFLFSWVSLSHFPHPCLTHLLLISHQPRSCHTQVLPSSSSLPLCFILCGSKTFMRSFASLLAFYFIVLIINKPLSFYSSSLSWSVFIQLLQIVTNRTLCVNITPIVFKTEIIQKY